MKAKEIREIEFKYGISKPNDGNMFVVIREIAAQLAELNDTLRKFRQDFCLANNLEEEPKGGDN